MKKDGVKKRRVFIHTNDIQKRNFIFGVIKFNRIFHEENQTY